MANPVYTDIVNGVAALMDDQSKAWAKEDFLLPFINLATRTVAAHLADNEVPTIRFRTPAITITAGSTTIAASIGLLVPALLVEAPVTMWEGTPGDPLSQYSLMTGSVPLSPNVEMTDTLRQWCWEAGTIRFIGATTDRSVVIDYYGGVDDFLNSGSPEPLTIPGAFNAVIFLTSGLVASSRGQRELAGDFGVETPDRMVTGRAGFALSTFINNSKAPEQGPVRMRPFIERRVRP